MCVCVCVCVYVCVHVCGAVQVSVCVSVCVRACVRCSVVSGAPRALMCVSFSVSVYRSATDGLPVSVCSDWGRGECPRRGKRLTGQVIVSTWTQSVELAPRESTWC